MSLQFESLYVVVVGDNLGDPGFWNLRFENIDVRLNAVEGFTNTANEAATEIINAGITQINEVFTPLLQSLVTQVDDMETTVSGLEQTVISDQNSVTEQLQSLLTQAEGLVSDLESLGVVDGGTF